MSLTKAIPLSNFSYMSSSHSVARLMDELLFFLAASRLKMYL